MKRIVLWAASITFLMALSATDARQALGQLELDAITAGICSTCSEPPEQYPTVIGSEWEITSRKESTPVIQNRRAVDYLPHNTSQPRQVNYQFNDGCRRVLVSGGVNIGKQLGFNVGTVIHCDTTRIDTFTVAPYSTITLYRADRVVYTTYTSREVWVYDNGMRESSGRTETARVESRISFLDPVQQR